MSVAVTSFAVFAASQVGTPGPANMVLMTTGARYGLRAALPFVLGVVLGKQLVIWPVGFGLMEVSDKSPWMFETLKFASAAYIIWLACPPEVWPLPECHLDAGTPNAILDGDGNPYREFPLGSIQQIEVHLIFDDLSTDSAKLNRQGVEMQ